MPHPRVRRALIGALVPLVLLPLASCGSDDASDAKDSASSSPATPSGPSTGASGQPYAKDLSELERKFSARLGVYAVDTGSGEEVAYRDGERFAYNSTFKALAAAVVLQKYSLDGLDRKIEYSEADLVDHSPVTEKHVDTGMTLGELCDAAVRYSDNGAANLIFDELGGPEALDAALEEIGDDVTRMEREEPELSRWVPGETRDTTTPRAFAEDLRAFVLGDVLDRPERAQLTTWLRKNTTGDTLIRAGVPDSWVVGDKTGSGSYHGARNDIAVLWPPDADPIVVSIMSNRQAKDAEADDRLIAEAASVVADSLA